MACLCELWDWLEKNGRDVHVKIGSYPCCAPESGKYALVQKQPPVPRYERPSRR